MTSSSLPIKNSALLEEASAKIRTGPPGDEPEDYDLPHWAGVIPLATATGTPEPDPGRKADVPVPKYVKDYKRKRD